MESAGRQSLLELLLPSGYAKRAVVVGSACPPRLAPASRGDDRNAPVDLFVLAPTGLEQEQDGWLSAAAERCAARLAPDGLVYVLVQPRARRATQRLLRAEGLPVESALLHLPDAAESRHLVPLEPVAARHAFKQIVSLVPWKRAAVGMLLGVGGAGLLAASQDGTALLARRPGARPLFDWLRALEGARAPYRGVVLSSSWRPGGPRVVLHPFSASPGRAVVAKAALDSPVGTLPEGPRLERLGSCARRAGASVPEPLGTAAVGGATVLLETRVEGRIVAPLLARRPARLGSVLERVAGWLEEWQRLTVAPSLLRPELLEREILSPAKRLASQLGGGSEYVAALSAACSAVEGATAPLTASHNDLTMWNVLLDDHGGLAVVDWEVAEEATLPLKDFFYAAVDAVAATDRYADRPGAYDACFEPRGSSAATVAHLEASMIAAVKAGPEIVELSRHACWLGHALNESRAAERSAPRPFLEIVRRLAAAEM